MRSRETTETPFEDAAMLVASAIDEKDAKEASAACKELFQKLYFREADHFQYQSDGKDLSLIIEVTTVTENFMKSGAYVQAFETWVSNKKLNFQRKGGEKFHNVATGGYSETVIFTLPHSQLKILDNEINALNQQESKNSQWAAQAQQSRVAAPAIPATNPMEPAPARDSKEKSLRDPGAGPPLTVRIAKDTAFAPDQGNAVSSSENKKSVGDLEYLLKYSSTLFEYMNKPGKYIKPSAEDRKKAETDLLQYPELGQFIRISRDGKSIEIKEELLKKMSLIKPADIIPHDLAVHLSKDALANNCNPLNNMTSMPVEAFTHPAWLGNTLLLTAIANSSADFALKLLDYPDTTHVNICSIHYSNCTPLTLCFSKGFNHVDSDKKTTTSLKEVAKKLVEKGANIHAVDKHHRSALHYACLHRDKEAIEFLIFHGAGDSWNAKDINGQTPLDFLFCDFNRASDILASVTGGERNYTFTLDENKFSNNGQEQMLLVGLILPESVSSKEIHTNAKKNAHIREMLRPLYDHASQLVRKNAVYAFDFESVSPSTEINSLIEFYKIYEKLMSTVSEVLPANTDEELVHKRSKIVAEALENQSLRAEEKQIIQKWWNETPAFFVIPANEAREEKQRQHVKITEEIVQEKQQPKEEQKQKKEMAKEHKVEEELAHHDDQEINRAAVLEAWFGIKPQNLTIKEDGIISWDSSDRENDQKNTRLQIPLSSDNNKTESYGKVTQAVLDHYNDLVSSLEAYQKKLDNKSWTGIKNYTRLFKPTVQKRQAIQDILAILHPLDDSKEQNLKETNPVVAAQRINELRKTLNKEMEGNPDNNKVKTLSDTRTPDNKIGWLIHCLKNLKMGLCKVLTLGHYKSSTVEGKELADKILQVPGRQPGR